MENNVVGYIILDEAHQPYDSKIVSGTQDKPIAEGILQDADAQNRNSRWYHKNDLASEIKAKRQVELIKTGNMKGENGHPMDQNLSRQQTIDPDKTCVKYLDIWMDGDYVKARYTGTNNQRGRDFDADLLSGELPSFSLRALGTITNNNGKAYVENLKVITWDRVIYPSHACAYTEKLVTESAAFETIDMTKVSENRREILEGSKPATIPFDNKGVIDFICQESSNIKLAMSNFDIFYETMELNRDKTRLTMRDKFGSTLVVPLEKFVSNQIMDYISNRY